MELADPSTWNLFVDCSLEDIRSRTRVVLVSPEGHKFNCTVRFNIKATNNVAKYEALIAGLRLARKMQVKRLVINSDFQLVVSQSNDNFSLRDKSMTGYLKLVMEFVSAFEKF